MTKQNLENQIQELNTKLSQANRKYESQLKYFQEKQQKEFLEEKYKDLEEQVERLKKNQTQILSAIDLRGVGDSGEGYTRVKTTSSEIINSLLHNSSLEKKVENIQNLFNQEKGLSKRPSKQS